MFSYKEKAASILKEAGIKINGNNSWDIQIYNENLYERVFRGGSLAFGEAYMDGWWDVPKLDQFFEKIFRAKIDEKINNLKLLPYIIKSIIFNPQKGRKSFEVGEIHYDIGNDLYSKMLDKRMVYSCAYWDACGNLPKARNLDEAQEHKLEMICRKLGLKKGDKVLDIGCGWGSLLIYAARKYGIQGVGLLLLFVLFSPFLTQKVWNTRGRTLCFKRADKLCKQQKRRSSN